MSTLMLLCVLVLLAAAAHAGVRATTAPARARAAGLASFALAFAAREVARRPDVIDAGVGDLLDALALGLVLASIMLLARARRGAGIDA